MNLLSERNMTSLKDSIIDRANNLKSFSSYTGNKTIDTADQLLIEFDKWVAEGADYDLISDNLREIWKKSMR